MNNDANEKMSKKELLDKRKELIIRVSSKSKASDRAKPSR